MQYSLSVILKQDLVQAGSAAPQRLEMYCSLFSTLCTNNLSIWSSGTEKVPPRPSPPTHTLILLYLHFIF